MPDTWQWEAEWYNWRRPLPEGFNVLMTVDPGSYEGSNHPDLHPVTWYREFEGGRSWYTFLGHRPENYDDPMFIKLLAGGILWAAGLKQ